MFGDCQAISIKHPFLVETVLGTFWVTFGNFSATFDFNIWSYWLCNGSIKRPICSIHAEEKVCFTVVHVAQ